MRQMGTENRVRREGLWNGAGNMEERKEEVEGLDSHKGSSKRKSCQLAKLKILELKECLYESEQDEVKMPKGKKRNPPGEVCNDGEPVCKGRNSENMKRRGRILLKDGGIEERVEEVMDLEGEKVPYLFRDTRDEGSNDDAKPKRRAKCDRKSKVKPIVGKNIENDGPNAWSLMCHQCQRNDKGRVVHCTKCKRIVSLA